MTKIDCLFHASDSLSGDVSWEYIAKLLVAWLYPLKPWRIVHVNMKVMQYISEDRVILIDLIKYCYCPASQE